MQICARGKRHGNFWRSRRSCRRSAGTAAIMCFAGMAAAESAAKENIFIVSLIKCFFQTGGVQGLPLLCALQEWLPQRAQRRKTYLLSVLSNVFFKQGKGAGTGGASHKNERNVKN